MNRFGLGPSSPGVKSPFLSIFPTKSTSWSSLVAASSTNVHVAGTRPISMSSPVPRGAVGAPAVGHGVELDELLHGEPQPPVRDIAGDGATLM